MLELLIEEGLVLTRAALLEDGRAVELAVAREEAAPLGLVALGRVTAVNPALDAAFVELPGGQSGFLPLRGGTPPQEGEALVVQVAQEATAGKGPRLGRDVQVAGRAAVYRPFGRGVQLSGRLPDEARRRLQGLGARLLAADAGGGLLFRTAAAELPEDEVAAEAAALAAGWRRALAAARPPAVLAGGEAPAVRLLAGWLERQPERIVVDGAGAFADLRAWCAARAPALQPRLVPWHAPRPLLEADGAEAAFDAAARDRVALPSGGALTLERTRALTAVDIDSGAAAGRARGALDVNLEAVEALADRLRLADLGGLFVVDFIGMERPGDGRRLLAGLDRALARDSAPISRSGLSPFGLVELTRRRRRTGLLEWLSEPCGACAAPVRRPSPLALAERLGRRARAEAAAWPGRPLRAAAAPAVVDLLEALPAGRLAQRTGARLTLARDGGLGERVEVGPA